MKINGKEYNFLLTVGASAEISELCPDGDMANLSQMLDGSFAKSVTVTAKMIAALSKGYEDNRSFAEDGYKPHYLTAPEILSLTQAEFVQLQQEAVEAFRKSQETTVEVETSKKK